MRFTNIAIIFGILILALLSACTRRHLKTIRKPVPEWVSSGIFQSLDRQQDSIILKYEHLKAKVVILADDTVFIESAWSNHLPPFPSYAVEEDPKRGPLTLEDTEDRVIINSSRIRVEALKSSFEVRIYKGESLIHRFQVFKDSDKEKLYLYSPRQEARFFGLGEKTGAFELTGRSFTMYNKDTYRYQTNTDPIYTSIPFYHVIGKDWQYGLFFDNPGKMKLELNDPRHEVTLYDYYTRVYIFTGSSKEIIQKYSRLTGMPFLPPLYGFGFHQSRYSYTNQAQVMEIAQSFREHDLPLDVLYLDIGFMSNHMSFTYEARRFPDPQQMNRSLKKMGVRTVAIVDPGIKVEPRYDVYAQGLKKDVYVYYKGKPYKGSVWPGMCNFPDFTRTGTSDWWGKYYQRLLNLGISGFWNDMNEPSVFSGPGGTLPPQAIQNNQGYPREHKYLHNAYGLSMIKSTYTEVQKLTPRDRVFLLTRSGYSGMQKYAMIWTGDNTAQWDHIRMNLSMVMNLGLSGVPYSGADIGGYSGSPRKELFTRWIQLATFIPFMRDHTEKNTRFQEPYRFEKTLPIIRKYMKMRYTLLPYLYTQAYLSHTEGVPIVRPLWLEFGKKYLDIDEQFMYGADIMVAPVLYPKKKKSAIQITLPSESGWNNMHDRQETAGQVSIAYNLEDIPYFQRQGSIIPLLAGEVNSTMEIDLHSDILLFIAPDKEGFAEGLLYRDDYQSMDYQNGRYLLTTFSFHQTGEKAIFTMKHTGPLQSKAKYRLQLPNGIKTIVYKEKEYPVENNQIIL